MYVVASSLGSLLMQNVNLSGYLNKMFVLLLLLYTYKMNLVNFTCMWLNSWGVI